MIFERFPEPIDALIIKDTFNENELSSITNEITSFSDKLHKGETVWLSDVYKSLDSSHIHNSAMEKFFDRETVDTLTHINSLYGVYSLVNNHSTQVRYFGDNQSYPLHYDAAAFTIMSFFFDGEKNFDGGELTLQVGADIAYENPIENNTSVIFPSSYYAAISQVNIKDKNIDNSGLYVVSSYLFVESR